MDELSGPHRLDHLLPANASTHSSTDDPASRAEGLASLVVVLGSSLSLVGLVFAFITYSLFSDLRNLSGTTLMNLLAGLFMAQLLYVIGVGGVQDPDLCSALSLSLQYVRLAVLCWLTASAHHMHASFRDAPSAPGPPSAPKSRLSASFVRYSLFGWGLPLLCLAASSLLQQGTSGHHDHHQHHHHHHQRMRHLRRPPHEHMVDQLLHHEALVLGTKVDHLQPHRHNFSSSSSLEDLAVAEGDCWFPEGDSLAFAFGFLVPALLLLAADAVLIVKSALLARHNTALVVLDKKAGNKIRVNRRLQICLFTRLFILLGFVTLLGAAARISTVHDKHHPQPSHQLGASNSSAHLLTPFPGDGAEVTEAEAIGKDASHAPMHNSTEASSPGGNALWLAFDVANALQGIMVALFVTCDCGVLRLYTRSLRRSSSRRRRRRSGCGRGRGRATLNGARHHHHPQWRVMPKSSSLQVLTCDPTPDMV